MILYQDTSSIVKRYVRDERGVEQTRQAVDKAAVLAASLIAYAEVRAAFARANRGNRFVDEGEYSHLLRDFERDWRSYAKVNLSQSLIRRAGNLAEKHALRGYDAVHLASALTFRDRVPDTIVISTWDGGLAQAAASEGLAAAHDV